MGSERTSLRKECFARCQELGAVATVAAPSSAEVDVASTLLEMNLNG